MSGQRMSDSAPLYALMILGGMLVVGGGIVVGAAKLLALLL